MAANVAPNADPENHEPSITPTNGTSRAESRPITIALPDDLLRKLKVIAIVRETSVTELVAEAAAVVVRREIKKALAKLEA